MILTIKLAGALNVVLLYLAGSSATVLENVLVEKEHLASAVYYCTDDHPNIEIRFTLTSVATEDLARVEQRFFEVLKEAMAEEIDMEYMHECIRRHVRGWKFATEVSSSSFSEFVITDFLYGKRDGSTLLQIATVKEYDELKTWTDGQWRGFINKWIAEAPHTSILGVPSSKLAEKLKTDEEARLEAQKEKLGEAGLKKLGERLEKAKAENDKEIPKEMLAQFQVPGTDSIHFIDTTTARSGSALTAGRPDNKYQQKIDADGSDLPLFIHFEHIPSNFVQLNMVISAESVPVELRPLLAVYMEAYFVLPVNRGGKTIDFEQVVVELERDTVGYNMSGAAAVGNVELLRISFQVELEKYSTAIEWIKELTWNTVFDVERLQATTTRLLADVPDLKRSGDNMLRAVNSMIHYTQESNVRARSALVKGLYLKRTKRLLESKPEVVVARMEEIRNSLFRLENIRVLVIADLEKLDNPVSSWKSFVGGMDTKAPLQEMVKRSERLSDAGKNPGELTYIVPMRTIDSSFSYITARGPDSYDHPKLPALLVAIAYMNSVEGPLWVAVRGTGLAYGTNFGYNVDTGAVFFDVYRSPNAHRAFTAGKKIIEDYLSGAEQFDPMMLEGAISSIVVGFANEQATITDAAVGSFIRQVVRDLPSDYNKKMLKKVREISVDEIKEVLQSIIMPLFTPGKSNVIVTCAPILDEVSSYIPSPLPWMPSALLTECRLSKKGLNPLASSLRFRH